jgi:O-acetyl-ADP-ribose deacetylase (regulator of RNase III)
MIIERNGNIFTTQAQTIVNSVNCVGVMGAGIAFEFRLREPNMFEEYKRLCKNGEIAVGKLWTYDARGDHNYKKILNFPTKIDWKYPTQEKYLHLGLTSFINTYAQNGITSIAFPLLGADRGNLDKERSLQIMESYLKKCAIDVEIWQFDPRAKDDLFDRFANLIRQEDLIALKKSSRIRADILRKLVDGIGRSDVNSLSGLLKIDGVGDATIEKLFRYVLQPKQERTLLDFINESG